MMIFLLRGLKDYIRRLALKIININLGKDLKELRIIPISDVHIGDKLSDLKLFKKVLETIRDEPNVYTIINGDLCNTALKNSKSDVYADELSPMQQIEYLIELLEPIKDKILVLGTGNHEDRITKETNIDVIKLVAKQLGIEDRYAESWWYLFLRFGEKTIGRKAEMCYQITGYHGSGGGGRKAGGKINKLQEMSNIVIADLYLQGHHHQQIATKSFVFIPDYGNNSLNKKELNFLMTNSFLEYGGYGEKAGFIPQPIGISEAILDGNKRKIKILLR